MTKKTKTKKKTEAKLLHRSDQKLPFVEHFKELKRRLTIAAVSVLAFSTAAYFVQMHIVHLLLLPAEGQKLIYTSVGGGLDFLLRVCIYTGIILSLPVIVYQVLKYFEPIMGKSSVRFALGGAAISGALALAGMVFGYFAGLPAVMHFLFNQFSTHQISSLIAAQSYLNFVALYMFGAAMLFQVPLLLIFINRIKPLKPSGLIKKERWMILIAFILAVLMNPSPNLLDQLMIAGPMILMYQIGIAIIWFVNRPGRSQKLAGMLARDEALRSERLSRLADAQLAWHQAEEIADHTVEAVADSIASSIKPVIQHLDEGLATPVTVRTASTARPRQYVDGFQSRPRLTV